MARGASRVARDVRDLASLGVTGHVAATPTQRAPLAGAIGEHGVWAKRGKRSAENW